MPLALEELPDPEPKMGMAVVRVEAAGICQSDAHYRAGAPRLPPLPRTLGHEIAGVVVGAHRRDEAVAVGDRVGVHYQTSCGRCERCRGGRSQFCADGAMIGNHLDGGYAEMVSVPVDNLVPLPPQVGFANAAVMMCSTVTALHALHRARFSPGESVAVFGLGGLGMSAVQLASALGASRVYGVDLHSAKTEVAARLGAVPLLAGEDPVAAIREAGGVDVALELVGSPVTTRQAVGSLAIQGRAAIVGLSHEPTVLDVYDDLLGREAEIVGVMDHTKAELVEVLGLAAAGDIDLDVVVQATVPLDAERVNAVLDALDASAGPVRTVILPDR